MVGEDRGDTGGGGLSAHLKLNSHANGDTPQRLACACFTGEFRKTVCVVGKSGSSVQRSLHKSIANV